MMITRKKRNNMGFPPLNLKFNKFGIPYETDSQGNPVETALRPPRRNAAIQSLNASRSFFQMDDDYNSNIDDDNDGDSYAHFMVTDKGGTSDDPFVLDESDEEDKDKQTKETSTTTTSTTSTSNMSNENSSENNVNGENVNGNVKVNGNTNESSAVNATDAKVNDESVVVSTVATHDSEGNIQLVAKGISIYVEHDYPLTSPVLFKDNYIEIKAPFIAISTTNRQKFDIVIQIKYEDLTKINVNFLKNNTSIQLGTKAFSFTKHWLKVPKICTNYELGIPNLIWLKGINKNDFNAIQQMICDKSHWIKLLLKTETHGLKKEKIIARYPPPNDNPNAMDIVRITSDDMNKLEPNQYLNDSIIDFYTRYIKDHYVTEEDRDRFYFFNTFFYNNLTLKKNMDEAYKKIAKWTGSTDIFSKDFLFIPICENFHWTLCIISFVGQDYDTSTASNRPLIMFLDSLNNHKLVSITGKIRTYLSMEWKYKKADPSNGAVPERIYTSKNLPSRRPSVPRQDNLCDCGVFLLHYVELFCRNPEKNFENPLNRPKWFPNEEIKEKREIIKSLLERLHYEQMTEEELAQEMKEEEEREKEKLERKKLLESECIAIDGTKDTTNKPLHNENLDVKIVVEMNEEEEQSKYTIEEGSVKELEYDKQPKENDNDNEYENVEMEVKEKEAKDNEPKIEEKDNEKDKENENEKVEIEVKEKGVGLVESVKEKEIENEKEEEKEKEKENEKEKVEDQIMVEKEGQLQSDLNGQTESNIVQETLTECIVSIENIIQEKDQSSIQSQTDSEPQPSVIDNNSNNDHVIVDNGHCNEHMAVIIDNEDVNNSHLKRKYEDINNNNQQDEQQHQQSQINDPEDQFLKKQAIQSIKQ